MKYIIARAMPETIEIMGAQIPTRWFVQCAARQNLVFVQINGNGECDISDLVLEANLMGLQRTQRCQFAGRPNWSGRSNSYLYACVRNLVRDAARKQRRQTRMMPYGDREE